MRNQNLFGPTTDFKPTFTHRHHSLVKRTRNYYFVNTRFLDSIPTGIRVERARSKNRP